MLPKPDGVDELHAVVDDVPRGRSELLELSGVSLDAWRPAISYLLESGQVRQLGTRRGAQYVASSLASRGLAVESVKESSAGYDGHFRGPRRSYHDLIEEALRELAGNNNGLTQKPRAEQLRAKAGPPAVEVETVESVQTWSAEDVRAALVAFRENVLQPDLRPGGRRVGLLRMTMIEALLRVRPRSRREFMMRMPGRLLEETDRPEIDEHLESVLEIVRRLAPER